MNYMSVNHISPKDSERSAECLFCGYALHECPSEPNQQVITHCNNCGARFSVTLRVLCRVYFAVDVWTDVPADKAKGGAA